MANIISGKEARRDFARDSGEISPPAAFAGDNHAATAFSGRNADISAAAISITLLHWRALLSMLLFDTMKFAGASQDLAPAALAARLLIIEAARLKMA